MTNEKSSEGQVVDETSDKLVDFAALPWESPAVGVSVKQTLRGKHRLRLVEFTDEFVETDWCRVGHVAYVIQGTLEIEFGARVIKVKAGDGLFIPAGEKHKARVPDGRATLFIVEDEVVPHE